MDDVIHAEEHIDAEVDVSELPSLEEQKDCCEKMLSCILDAENVLKNRISSIQTINNAVQSDETLIKSLSEFLGYHYGRMSSSRGMIEAVLVNLNTFMDGKLDEVDHGARGMFLTVWYNLGVSGLEDLDICLEDLEKMEMDIIGAASSTGITHQETLH
jgi:hypothetical protein